MAPIIIAGIFVPNTQPKMTNKMWKIAVLEDDPDMQAYLAYVVEQAEGFEFLFGETHVSEALKHLENDPLPDLCLVDLQLPDGNGVDFIRSVTSKSDCKCLVLTVLGDRTSVITALEAGAHGYLLKDSTDRMIIKNIEQTLAGANPISPEAATHLLSLLGNGQNSPIPQSDTLSTKEREILTYFAKGLSYKETAEMMELSVHTINDYVKAIYAKLRVHSKSEAIFEALQLGIIKL